MEKSCKCYFCNLFEKIDKISETKDFDELIKLNREIINSFIGESFDLSYYKSIQDGSWPNSIEILKKWISDIEKGSR